MSALSVLKTVCDVIQSEMALTDDQVYVWDQKIDTPTDSRLYVAVAIASAKPFANRRRYVANGAVLNEEQSLHMQAMMDITILSRGVDARDRKEEILLALNSTLAQQKQQAEGFFIARLPTSFVNLSELDGAAIPYRFTISVALQYTVTKTKAVDFYDSYLPPTVVTNP